MNKKFLDYLRKVEVALRCKDMDGRMDDDKRLYLFCRLQTVADYLKAKAEPEQTAAMLHRWYVRDIEFSYAWWRS